MKFFQLKVDKGFGFAYYKYRVRKNAGNEESSGQEAFREEPPSGGSGSKWNYREVHSGADLVNEGRFAEVGEATWDVGLPSAGEVAGYG